MTIHTSGLTTIALFYGAFFCVLCKVVVRHECNPFIYVPDEVGALKDFREERKEYLHKKNEQIKKKGSGREEQVFIF